MIHLLLFACISDPQTTESGETGGDSADQTEGPPLPPAYTGESCPDFSGDELTFTSLGVDRTVKLLWPDEPNGAPVIYFWHWLGGSASDAISYVQLNSLANQGYIVVVPEARDGELLEWGYFQDADDSYDLALFDDTLSCLNTQYEIDRSRVYSTGFSAGALFTTRLGMKRSQYLAAIAPLSGGTEPFQPFVTPERALPVLATWGGPEDLYLTLSFEDATLEFAEKMGETGSFVALCEHSGGHTLPPVNIAHVKDFFAAHSYGEETPWAGGLPEDLWSGCFLPEAGE